MARAPLIVAALLLSLLFLAQIGVGSSAEIDLRIKRTIEPTYGGLTYVTDVITGHGGASFRYGIPGDMDERLVDIRVIGGEIKRVGVTFAGMVLYEVNPEGDPVTVIAIYQGLISYIGGDNYALELSPQPFIDERVIEADILVKENEDVKYPSGQSGWQFIEEGLLRENVTVRGQNPPKGELIRFTSSNFAIVRVDKQELTYLPAEGKIKVDLTVTNLSGRRLESLKIHLPEGSRLIKLYDLMGSIGRSYNEERGVLTVNIGASRYVLEQSWRYSFSVEAEVPQSSGIQSLLSDEVRVRAIRLINATMGVFDVKVVLPPGYAVENPDEEVKELYEDIAGRLVARLNIGERDRYRESELRLSIRRGAEQASVDRVLIISGLIAMTAGVISYRLVSRRGLETELTEKQRSPVASVIKEVERLRVLIEDLDKLTSAKRGRTPPTVVQEKIQAIRRTRDRVHEGVSKLDERPRWVEAKIRELESAMDELYDTCMVVTRNYTDLLSGKISRSAYEKIHERFGRDARRSLSHAISAAESLKEWA